MLDDISAVSGSATYLGFFHDATVCRSRHGTRWTRGWWRCTSRKSWGNCRLSSTSCLVQSSLGKASSLSDTTNHNVNTITQDQKHERLAVGAIAVAYPSHRYSEQQRLKRCRVFHCQVPTFAQFLSTRYFIVPWIYNLCIELHLLSCYATFQLYIGSWSHLIIEYPYSWNADWVLSLVIVASPGLQSSGDVGPEFWCNNLCSQLGVRNCKCVLWFW